MRHRLTDERHPSILQSEGGADNPLPPRFHKRKWALITQSISEPGLSSFVLELPPKRRVPQPHKRPFSVPRPTKSIRILLSPSTRKRLQKRIK
ncbi:hypothetical protein AVEN_108927-1 [Araneus ventricosus]|uniref:Uncharacterized protein n=1 Tax=Araneus ventricosus TaxID=182803 RepID=A0A4Y2EP03_ARAVE|nr:hypothetical protein AVEN_108927-1 [Araneus ventricosus]